MVSCLFSPIFLLLLAPFSLLLKSFFVCVVNLCSFAVFLVACGRACQASTVRNNTKWRIVTERIQQRRGRCCGSLYVGTSPTLLRTVRSDLMPVWARYDRFWSTSWSISSGLIYLLIDFMSSVVGFFRHRVMPPSTPRGQASDIADSSYERGQVWFKQKKKNSWLAMYTYFLDLRAPI